MIRQKILDDSKSKNLKSSQRHLKHPLRHFQRVNRADSNLTQKEVENQALSVIYSKKTKDEIILVGKIMEAGQICSQRVIKGARMERTLVFDRNSSVSTLSRAQNVNMSVPE